MYSPYARFSSYTPTHTSRQTLRQQPHHQHQPQPQPQPQQAPHFIYVFDLDDVLMPTTALFNQPGVREWLSTFYRTNQLSQIAAGYQRVLHPNPTLIHYLHQLPGQKHILTNASRAHAYASLQALGLHTYVQSVVDADQGIALKPDPAPYHHLQNMLLRQYEGLPPETTRPRIVFFDDRIENHYAPKRLGWTTVWIYGAVDARERARHQVIPTHVDVAFATIEEALRYFVSVGGG